MKTQFQLSFSILLSLSILLPFQSQAQSDFSKFNPYDDEIVEDLQISSEQLIQLYAADDKFGAERTRLNQALLYHEDFDIETEKVFAQRSADIEKILSAEQIEQYQNRVVDQQLLRKDATQKMRVENYLTEYQFLGISSQQAQDIASAFEVWEANPQMDRDKMQNETFKDVLTNKQFKLYKKHLRKGSKETPPHFGNYRIDEEAITKKVNLKMQIWKNYFLPERTSLRDNLEMFISPEDKELIEELRTVYNDLLEESLEENSKTKRLKNGPSKAYLRAFKQMHEIKSTEIIGIPPLVNVLVQKDRETFNKAKDLAIQYDELIDGLQKELMQLNLEVKEKIKAQTAPEPYNIINPSFYVNTTDLHATDRVELYRNIAFLLIAGNADDRVKAEKQVHQFNAYPNPAQETQSIDFQLNVDGEVIIELLSQDGKLLQVVFEGHLNKGNHVKEIDLREVAHQVFYYRLKNAEGSTVLKGMKVK